MDKYKQNVPFKHVMPDGTEKEIVFVENPYVNCRKCAFYPYLGKYRMRCCLPCSALDRGSEVSGIYVSVETK